MLIESAVMAGMFVVEKVHAEESPAPSTVIQTAPPRPYYRINRDQHIEGIRKRFEKQLKDDEKAQDPYAEMWDLNWINKKETTKDKIVDKHSD